MAVFVDLDEGHDPQAHPRHDLGSSSRLHELAQTSTTSESSKPEKEDVEERPNPNINTFSAALSCYPIVSQLAQHLDLNSLDDLSRTCRQIHFQLLQHAAQLKKLTLRCANDSASLSTLLGSRIREMQSNLATNNNAIMLWPEYGRLTSGKVGRCARDSVGGCRRCGTVVCRNCVAKPPSPTRLQERHRRLCQTCCHAPLSRLTAPFKSTSIHNEDTAASSRSTSASPPSSVYSFTSEEDDDAHDDADSTAQRGPCTCSDEVWYCQPCGNALRTADTQYTAGWTWRSTYSYMGGFGAGLGEGIEGVVCGRSTQCLAARTVEKELECTADELEKLQNETEEKEKLGRSWRGTSYLAQEMMGIGGIVMKKVKRKERVGSCVRKWEDENNAGEYLGREKKGEYRSWCAWCQRVILGKDDVAKNDMKQ